jgi:hypothetical protein
LLELLNAVFRLAGAPADSAALRSGDVEAVDIDEEAALAAESITSETPLSLTFLAASSSGSAPLPPQQAQQAQYNRRLRTAAAALWSALADECAQEVLFGELGAGGLDLVEGLLDWLIPLSASTNRPLRHAAAFACLHLALGLLQRAQATRLSEGKAAAQQLDSARSAVAHLEAKAGSARQGKAAADLSAALAAARAAVEESEQAAAAVEAQAVAAEEAVESVFKSVFAHRYRDASADIRADCVDLAGRWAAAAPALYLTNSHLKYLGWMLNDGESAVVREAALNAIAHIYDSVPRADCAARTADFLGRFRARIAAMVRDAGPRVRLAAVRVLHRALLLGQLSDAEVRCVEVDGVGSDDAAVRAASGALLVDCLPAFRAEDGEVADSAQGEDDEGAAAEDEEDAQIDVDGPRSKSGRGSARGAKAASASASAKAAAAARRARQQLLSLVALVETIGVPAIDDLRTRHSREVLAAVAARGLAVDPAALDDAEADAAAPSPEALADELAVCVPHVVSAFWGQPRTQVLVDWHAFRSLLLNTDAASTMAAAAASPAEGEVTEVTQRLLLRILSECARRAAGESELDAQVSVYLPAATATASGAGQRGKSRAAQQAAASRAAGSSPTSSPQSAMYLPHGDELTAGSNAASVRALLDACVASAMSADAADIARSRERLSEALGATMPDLFARFCSGDAHNTVVVCSLLGALSPSGAFGGSARAKAFADTLYHLGRLFLRETQPTALAALATCLRLLATAEHSRSREAGSALRKALTAVVGRVLELSPAVVNGTAGAALFAVTKGKKGRRTTKGRGTSNDDEGDEMEPTGTGAAATVESLVFSLRRLSELSAQVPTLFEYSDALALPTNLADAEATGVGVGSLYPTLSDLLMHCRRLRRLFAAASAEDNDAEEGDLSGDSAWNGGLSFELATLSLRVMSTLANHAVLACAEEAGKWPKAYSGGDVPPSELVAFASACAALEDKIDGAVFVRNLAVSHAQQMLALRHPALVAAATPETEAEDGDTLELVDDVPFAPPGAESVQPVRLPIDTYRLPYGVGIAARERVYIARCRLAGFHAICGIGLACAPAAMTGSFLSELAWTPAEDVVHVLAVFLNQALSSEARDLEAMGVRVAGFRRSLLLHRLARAEAIAAGQIDLEDEGDALAEEELQRADQGGPDFEPMDLPEGCSDEDREAWLQQHLQTRLSVVQSLRSRIFLLPLASLSIAAPTHARLGHMLGRRVQEGDNEGGPVGVALVKAHIKRTKERDPESLLLQQLRSIVDGCTSLGRMRGALSAVLERIEAPEGNSAEAEEENASTLDAMQKQGEHMLIAFVGLMKTQARVLPPRTSKAAATTFRAPLVSMIKRGVQFALRALPDSLSVLSLLCLYLPYLPAGAESEIAEFLRQELKPAILATQAQAMGVPLNALTPDQHREGLVAANALLTAAGKWWSRKLRSARLASDGEEALSVDVDGAMAADGYTVAELRPYAPLLAFRDALANRGAGSVPATIALRVHTGLSAVPAGGMVGVGSGGSGGNLSGRGSGTRKRKRSARTHGSESESEDEELDDEEEQEEEPAGRSRSARVPVAEASAPTARGGRRRTLVSSTAKSAGKRGSSGTRQVSSKGDRDQSGSEEDDDMDKEEDDEDEEDIPVRRKTSTLPSKRLDRLSLSLNESPTEQSRPTRFRAGKTQANYREQSDDSEEYKDDDEEELETKGKKSAHGSGGHGRGLRASSAPFSQSQR